MADGKIVVELNLNVRDDQSSKDPLDVEQSQQEAGIDPVGNVNAKGMAKGVNNATSKAVATYIGTQAIRWGLSNYGNLTGDYLAQDALQNAVSLAGVGIAMVQSPIMGGAVAATMLVTAGVNRLVEMGNQERRANSITERVGTIISTGGRDL